MYVDEVVVWRICHEQQNAPANNAERFAVVAEWQRTGRTLKDLARITGWKVCRYIDKETA